MFLGYKQDECVWGFLPYKSLKMVYLNIALHLSHVSPRKREAFDLKVLSCSFQSGQSNYLIHFHFVTVVRWRSRLITAPKIDNIDNVGESESN